MVRIDKIFDVVYGVNLELVNCNVTTKDVGMPFVSRTSKNNGVVAFVDELEDCIPNPPHTISVAGSGSVLSCFYQEIPYYSGRDLFYLKPKIELSITQMLYYCYAINSNAYKYSYGRQANKTLREISIPDVKDIPNDFLKRNIPLPDISPASNSRIKIDTSNWKLFKYGGKNGIFIIKNGYYNRKPDHTEDGTVPFIGATEFNNGITEYYTVTDIQDNNKDERSQEHDFDHKVFKGNCVTVTNNGSVGCAFYQEQDFTCSHDVNVLLLKEKDWNKYIAMFICSLIELEKFRWTFGRKWRPSRMPDSEIRLPVDKKGSPDWDFMENYIKSLPYSKSL